MLSARVFAAFFAVAIAAFILMFRWKEMDIGQRIFGCAFGVVFVMAFIYVPFRIPTTGDVVHGFIWQPAEYRDENAGEILTSEAIAEIEDNSPISVSEDWVQNSLVRQAPMALVRHRIYLGSLLLTGAIGWLVLPPLLTRVVYGGWRRRS